LTTLRANLDYGEKPAVTTYGVIGIRVWIYKKD
ncbi:MAG TPA: 30S ribosomal protein S3, partial [candidate division WWE3 bacterium]|nr:30S ribosomal protein S3 [candidate division WWE3 bacterium]